MGRAERSVGLRGLHRCGALSLSGCGMEQRFVSFLAPPLNGARPPPLAPSLGAAAAAR
eukprot:gene39607-25074_t